VEGVVRKALTVALLQVAATRDRPLGVAGEDPPARLHLVVNVHDTGKLREPPEHGHGQRELPGVHVFPIAGDVPATGEHQPGTRTCVVEHSLGGTGGVVVHPPRHQHRKHGVASVDRPCDDRPVVGRSGEHGDPSGELGELGHAALPAHTHDLIPAVQRVLHQVAPELAGRADDAHPLPRARLLGFVRTVRIHDPLFTSGPNLTPLGYSLTV
jgi:hypothetical protein